MSLILFAFVVRVRDGLPLSASTDFLHNKELQEKKQQLKVISKSLNILPERGIIKGHDLNIYFLSSKGVSYMTVCACGLPAAMAFCFLEDLCWEFTACFDSSAVALASRPYPFLEFDSTIQKLQHHYNQNKGPSLEITLIEVQEELSTSPPQVLTMEDVMLANGVANGHVDQTTASDYTVCTQSMKRYIVVRSLSQITFLSATQCHLYLFHICQKKLKAITLLILIILCNAFLFDVRNIWQLIFHMFVACISTLLTLHRKLLDRNTDCGV
ncbi:Vesicle-trafficking protein SEC22c SEC22 vesicle-trafficking protein -like protein C [Triplophysa tibetana]|uniref:Vesicle-trafficking protein SEC22c SEC22 vesicle-trafficking protein-like protein C n=1 Tax=Triplophysa tibetana TaxID=1572043 RepID=A0A5A9N6T6_9TELE|nr:Vesicle-trafficking protein SEC22c SEC22 vesicle-trafficking protein -like protein C [Triplophysa tibetana]